MVESINENPILDGVTFSGGDPFFNPKDFGYILKRIKKETGKNIWVYTGYRFEELLEHIHQRKVLQIQADRIR